MISGETSLSIQDLMLFRYDFAISLKGGFYQPRVTLIDLHICELRSWLEIDRNYDFADDASDEDRRNLALKFQMER